MDVVAAHIGTDHLWSTIPLLVVGTLVFFLGAVVVRTKLQRWVEEDDGPERKR